MNGGTLSLTSGNTAKENGTKNDRRYGVCNIDAWWVLSVTCSGCPDVSELVTADAYTVARQV
jgi:hypothetical protein